MIRSDELVNRLNKQKHAFEQIEETFGRISKSFVQIKP